MIGEDVLRILRNHLTELRALGVARLGLFGSFATGKQKVESDIDILVSFESGKKTFDNLIDLKFRLEELFPDRRVDLVLESALKPAIRPYVQKTIRYVA
jgi:predicted nucleotidyltransferase